MTIQLYTQLNSATVHGRRLAAGCHRHRHRRHRPHAALTHTLFGPSTQHSHLSNLRRLCGLVQTRLHSCASATNAICTAVAAARRDAASSVPLPVPIPRKAIGVRFSTRLRMNVHYRLQEISSQPHILLI